MHCWLAPNLDSKVARRSCCVGCAPPCASAPPFLPPIRSVNLFMAAPAGCVPQGPEVGEHADRHRTDRNSIGENLRLWILQGLCASISCERFLSVCLSVACLSGTPSRSFGCNSLSACLPACPSVCLPVSSSLRETGL
jgi:hypothetical protein